MLRTMMGTDFSVAFDRSRRTVSFDPFLGCVTGVSCRAAFQLKVASTSWQPPDVLVHWTVRVHATAYGGYLPEGTAVELQ